MVNKEQNEKKGVFSPFPALEEEVLEFWDKAGTFEQSVNKDAPEGEYVFYDGPPFGTGEPHYGHILSSVTKDVIPRYFTMKGYRVERRWGWDCHGLPIENIIEKDLKISGKKQIEEMGIAKFNEACRSRVLEYADIWDVMVRRIGRWVDFKNSYKTMDPDFMESVWWGFKQMYEKDLVYEGRKVLLYCPRCETPISNFEVAMDNSYREIDETSVYVKFKVTSRKEASEKLGVDGDLYILAWTTTPWTLPGNVALAVGEDLDYVLIDILGEGWTASPAGNGKPVNIKNKSSYFILAKNRLEDVITKKGKEFKIIKEIKGADLVGLEYEPLFDVPALKESGKKVYYVAAADFVTTEDGTGVVHTAVVYGEDDYNLGIQLDLPVVPALDEKGVFNETVPELAGTYFLKANKIVIEKLAERGQLFAPEKIKHSYPHCHRCDTQLFYNAIPAWFISIDKLRKRMVELNENINWYPEHLKEGRFRQGIEQAPDWNISRNRYFATPIPIWKCGQCGHKEAIGSVKDLEEKSGEKGIEDIHSHFIDHLFWDCAECKDGKMSRIKEVFDCWVESGSMSFAQHHYPFENKERFESTLPAQFISEYISQTRAWFYVMHVVSTALFDKNSYENVVTNGVILNEKAEKMSKSKKNYPDPWQMINEFGVDTLRFYLMNSSVMHADNLLFSERDLRDIFRKHSMILWNVFKFFDMYATKGRQTASAVESDSILDKWIMARLNELIAQVGTSMDGYDTPRATRPISEFIDDMSTWYIRRSRDRYKGDDAKDKEAALATTAFALSQLSLVMAPFMPFLAEQIWQKVNGFDFKDDSRSVHLEKWPQAGESDKEVIEKMELVKKIVELGLAKRDEHSIKVRQPLAKLEVINAPAKLENIYLELIKEEVNVKSVILKNGSGDIEVELDTELSPELMAEGVGREIVRSINALRKQGDMTIEDKAEVLWQSDDNDIREVIEGQKEGIMRDTLSVKMEFNAKMDMGASKTVKVNGKDVHIEVKKK